MKTTRNEQGIALVVVLLSAMVLIVALLAVTSTLALSSRRTTTDQRVTLQAQYAAESGLGRAQSKLQEVEMLLNRDMRVPANANPRTIENHAENFCGDGAAINSRAGQAGQSDVFCQAVPVDAADADRFSLFTDYIPRSAYPEGTTDVGEYWRKTFSDGSTTTEVATDPATGAKTEYSTSFGLRPSAVRLVSTNSYRFEFTVSPVESTGEVTVDGDTVATRTVRLETPGTFNVTVNQPSFSKYVLFRNRTTNTNGGQLYFAGGERFNGPVHTNGRPGLARFNGQLPQFLSEFTTASSRADHIGVSSRDYPNIFRGDPEEFNADAVPLPPNNNNQLRASFGGDASDSSRVRERDLKRAWNVSEMNDGVYYSRGNGNKANRANDWTGGLYIKGNVSDLTFSTRGGKQVIKVTQVVGTRTEERYGCYRNRRGRLTCGVYNAEVTDTKTTTFRQEDSDTWTVEESDSSGNGNGRTRLSGNFNGMIYVDGAVESLGGDGSDAADIASNSQLTLATTGDVTVRRSLTYTDDPRQDEDAENVLGIYSNGGSVLLNGPSLMTGETPEDLNLHASVMASAQGEGFGTVHSDRDLGRVLRRNLRVNLLGGVIEDQSQTVGSLRGDGYQRNYTHDPRFAEGFAPPFFPTQTDWESEAPAFSRQQGLWEVGATDAD